MISAIEALRILQDGNRRFVAGLGGVALATNQARRAQLIMGQQPFAVLLGCADSRVPGELVFDQGLGELFVIRVAGNIVARPRSAASNLPSNASAPGWWWCLGIPAAVPSLPRWKN